MLASPMAAIDMDKTDEELYGVEHLSSIVIGNWFLFGEAFGSKTRAEVYFGEISELRHNVSHRRQRHMLRRGELIRFVRNAQMLLAAFGSPVAAQFETVAGDLEQGGSPWGHQLGGTLPPATEIVSEFVGRQVEMRTLSSWLTTDNARQCVNLGFWRIGQECTSLSVCSRRSGRRAVESPRRPVA